MIYRPACPRCRHCVAARIPVADFTPDRSQRRSGQRNADLRLEVSPSTVTEEHFDLYRRYVNARHPGGGMEDPTPEACRSFLLADWCATRFLDLRLEGRLVATAVTDVIPGALSAVYTFFEPGLSRRSLGTFAVMTQAAFAQRHGLDHLYLGYWVDGSPKMEYKARFRPLEVFRNGAWHLLRQNRAPPTS